MPLFKKKVQKTLEPRLYILVCQVERDADSKRTSRVSYIFNKETEEFDRKDFADICMLCGCHTFSSFDDAVSSIESIIQRDKEKRETNSKRMRKFLSNAISIGIVEEYIEEGEKSFRIRDNFHAMKMISPQFKNGVIIKDAQLVEVEKRS